MIEFRERSASQRLRLAISLHQTDVGAVWPRAVSAWLYDESGTVADKNEIGCAGTQAGVEEALTGLVDWGMDVAERIDVRLEHVDVALPTTLLASEWQPEAVEYHARLDEAFRVTVRWADRLRPSGAMRRSIKHAAQRLADIGRSTVIPPVDWLDGRDVRDPAQLRERFVNGQLNRGGRAGPPPARLSRRPGCGAQLRPDRPVAAHPAGAGPRAACLPRAGLGEAARRLPGAVSPAAAWRLHRRHRPSPRHLGRRPLAAVLPPIPVRASDRRRGAHIMSWEPLYRGDGIPRQVDLPVPPPWRVFPRLASAVPFEPTPALTDAVNAALCLRRPLLITGPAGSGKSTVI